MLTLRRTLLLLLIPAIGMGCGNGNNDGDGLTDPPAENQAPATTILTPDDGVTYAAGDAILFQGFAADPEDGEVPSGDLSWSSDISGHFGDGGALSSSGLVEGNHVITLTAVDSQGAQGTASLSLTIEPAVELDISGTWILTGDDGAAVTELVQDGARVTGDWTTDSGSAGTANLTLLGTDLRGQLQRTDPGPLSFDFEAMVDETGTTMAGSYTSTGLGDFNFTVSFTGSIQP